MTRQEAAVVIERMFPSFEVRKGKVFFPTYDLYEDLSSHIDDLLFFTHDPHRSTDETVMVMRKPTYQIRRLPMMALLRFIDRNWPYYIARLQEAGGKSVPIDLAVDLKRCQSELAIRTRHWS